MDALAFALELRASLVDHTAAAGAVAPNCTLRGRALSHNLQHPECTTGKPLEHQPAVQPSKVHQSEALNGLEPSVQLSVAAGF